MKETDGLRMRENQAAKEDAGLARLDEALALSKCLKCGCLHGALKDIAENYPDGKRSVDLDQALQRAVSLLQEPQYDCLGCNRCLAAEIGNALGTDNVSCGCLEEPVVRQDWPPLPGSYSILRYQASIAICTLTSSQLMKDLELAAGPETAIIGTLQTENLGIERLIRNITANPNLRFLIVCGVDSEQAVGHLPGQSLVALSRSGIDEHAHIIGARGQRPILRNIPPQLIEHFRRTVEVVDLIGEERIDAILEAARNCPAHPRSPIEQPPAGLLTPIKGYLPARMTADPAGYFVIYVDRPHDSILLEHYGTDGVLDKAINGHSAAEIYTPAIELGLVSRLDHAAYLGRELARAEYALIADEDYVQDSAPELQTPETGCGCAHCREAEL